MQQSAAVHSAAQRGLSPPIWTFSRQRPRATRRVVHPPVTAPARTGRTHARTHNYCDHFPALWLTFPLRVPQTSFRPCSESDSGGPLPRPDLCSRPANQTCSLCEQFLRNGAEHLVCSSTGLIGGQDRPINGGSSKWQPVASLKRHQVCGARHNNFVPFFFSFWRNYKLSSQRPSHLFITSHYIISF